MSEGSIRDHRGLVPESSFIERIARVVSSTLEIEELPRLLFVEMSRVLPLDGVALFWREPGGGFLVAAVTPGSSSVVVQHVSGGAVDDADEKPQAFLCPDNRSSSQPVLRWLGERDLPVSLTVPVVVAQQLLAWLSVLRAAPTAFSARELRPVAQVALVLGPAVNSFRLYERIEAAHKDLAAARDELVRSERLVVQGELASGAAHDINNILGLIAARADLLKLQGISLQAEASVDAIRKAVDDGITVVRRVNQFTRRQRSRELVGLDVNRLVEEVLEMTRPRWQSSQSKKGAAVRVSFKPGRASMVMGVPSELREVMVNLIMNAVDALPCGGDILVESRQEEGWAVISVSDTGCGITEEARQHIFEPFFTTKGESGSGLGLWVSHGILVRHGGDIQVHSEPGRGSCFTVKLPVATSAPAQPAQEVPGKGHSILVVDDEVGLGEALRLSLEIVGYKVVFSADPRAALNIFKAKAFDLVITDLRMPGMTGWELAAEIKRLNPRMPIIAMTGWPVDLIRDGQRSSDLATIIQKPYRVNELRAKVAKLLEASHVKG